ncbi:MAG: ribosome-associated protein [Cycloclasticus pugetii]|jgi:ribosome-associated protein|uniref:Ribosomal silencing factor RsfS n=1 Tax=Cycloclasticus pugetii TaxID=34068 RepID=A0AB33Z384_9GAMM|nr:MULTISPECIES: ribosome silencing factor [Cycloclasticus]AFT67693.1 PolyA polymerase, iojap protein [Cycloclasticus sp. P1]ATI02764.1 ribosome silencing factor [Cycloclasticus sp. PY97N]EPD13508.1 polyA polymerase, iojap protein [Cycloclasticus pugetii]MBV1897747.1 ribosome silencing factor [Cycloclasticus sp.]MDF1828779.1 ribosome silencing factor [Cycloclasticus pugetii]
MAQQLLTKVTEALDDKKGQHIEVIDVSGKCSFADHIVIVTGSSNRHVKSLAMEVSMVSKKHGLIPLGVEGMDAGEWVLIDLGDTIVHVMQPNIREFYQLEKLWTVETDT